MTMRRNMASLSVLFGICAMALYFLLKLPHNSAAKTEPSPCPRRIVSLGPSITKGLYLLGAEDKLIANTVYCISPSEAGNKEKVGSAIAVNVEKVFGLKPDLVLATSLTDLTAKEKLKSLGIRVVTFPAPRDFNDMCEQFLELGRIVGKEEEAKKIAGSAQDEAASIKKNIKALPKPKVLVQLGARPLFAATERYFVNDYIEFAGGVNIAKDGKEGIYSREQILKANPDVIIITAMGVVGEEEKRTWEKYETLSAAKSGRIHIMDADKVASPTPQSFVKTLEEFARILHCFEPHRAESKR